MAGSSKRSTAEGEEAALQIFDAFVAIARAQISAMADGGVIDPDTDIEWLALRRCLQPGHGPTRAGDQPSSAGAVLHR